MNRNEAILARFAYYGWRCAYCGWDLSTFKPGEDRRALAPQKDHRIPRWRGGLNIPSNIVPACASCNGKKGGRMWPTNDHATRIWLARIEAGVDVLPPPSACMPGPSAIPAGLPK